MSNLITNCLLIKICFHDGILILITIACLITPLDRGKWKYTDFDLGIKDIVLKCLNTLELFSEQFSVVISLFPHSLGKSEICPLLCFSWGNYGYITLFIKQLSLIGQSSFFLQLHDGFDLDFFLLT